MIDFLKDEKYQAKQSEYHGCERYDFLYNGHWVTIVIPKSPVHKNKWVWRAEFFDAFPIVDLDLLSQGWYLTYYSISDMYGNKESIELMKKFRDFITEKFDLHPKTTLFGFSRGGLYSVNYAAKYPEDVACLYLDAPVMDICSWPAGFGKSFDGQGTPSDWEICKKVLGITDETAREYKDNPKDHIEELAKADIPIYLVSGDADKAAPLDENGQILIDNYKKLGATKFEAFIMPGKGHHPHSVEDPKPVSDFINSCYKD